MKEFITLHSGVIQLAIVLVATIVALLLRKKFARTIVRLIHKYTKLELPEYLHEEFEKSFKPLAILFTVGVFEIAFEAILVNNVDSYKSAIGVKLIELVNKVPFNVIYLVLVGIVINNLLVFFTNQYKTTDNELVKNLNSTMMLMAFKVARYVAWIVIFGMILSELGYNVTGIFAGLGLSGVALALAAQDTVSNLFGCLVILLDKPFEIKDWIQTSDVEGIVEEINFRSTRIRTFDNALVAVPNSTLANSLITNWSKMPRRKLRFYINLTYSTSPEAIKKIKDEVQAYLASCDFVAKDSAMVNFEEMSSSSLDLRCDCQIKHKDIKSFLACREEINFKVLDIVTNNGGDFAFPSQSIYIEKQ